LPVGNVPGVYGEKQVEAETAPEAIEKGFPDVLTQQGWVRSGSERFATFCIRGQQAIEAEPAHGR